ncbi:MAG TPA: tetratricopeptide repeat protein [Terriglobia bacterium]|nr:tetratricopeptide repeat protein [Terriglobia bacterium]
MSRLVLAITMMLIATAARAPVSAQTPNRPGGFTISGQVVVPLANFQQMFEVLLLQNAEQLVQATVADSQGRYRFVGVPRGTYFINVKIEGFQEVRQRVDVGSESIINIILDFEEERTVVKPATDFSGEDKEVVSVTDISKTYSPALLERTRAAEKDILAGNYAKAVPVLEEVVREAPEFYQANRSLGTAYQKLGRFRDAESAYRTASELRPTSAAPLISLASLYVEESDASSGHGSAVMRGILNEALASLHAALKLNPDAPFAHYLLGVTYYKSALFEDAEDSLKQSLKLAPDLLEAHLALANLYVRIQEWPNAIAQLDAYLAASPKSPIRDQVQAMRSRVLTRSQSRPPQRIPN